MSQFEEYINQENSSPRNIILTSVHFHGTEQNVFQFSPNVKDDVIVTALEAANKFGEPIAVEVTADYGDERKFMKDFSTALLHAARNQNLLTQKIQEMRKAKKYRIFTGLAWALFIITIALGSSHKVDMNTIFMLSVAAIACKIIALVKYSGNEENINPVFQTTPDGAVA